MEFRHFVHTDTEAGIKQETINPLDIKEFGIINHPTWTTKHTFKTFLKSGFIVTKDNKFYSKIFSAPQIIDKIKAELKVFNIKYAVEKSYKEEYKKHSTCKAVDWNFKVIQGTKSD